MTTPWLEVIEIMRAHRVPKNVIARTCNGMMRAASTFDGERHYGLSYDELWQRALALSDREILATSGLSGISVRHWRRAANEIPRVFT